MASSIAYASDIFPMLQNVTNELRQLQDLLLFVEELDPSLLSNFRDLIDRIHQTTLAVQQYGELIANEKELDPIGSTQAEKRIRKVCHLCKFLEADLGNLEIHLQNAQLFGLHKATQELGHRLRKLIGNWGYRSRN